MHAHPFRRESMVRGLYRHVHEMESRAELHETMTDPLCALSIRNGLSNYIFGPQATVTQCNLPPFAGVRFRR
jgi:hypothetical protein